MPSKSNPQGRHKTARFLQDGEKAFASSVATPVLDHANLEQKQIIFQDESGGRLQSRLRGSLEAIEITTKQKM